MKAEAILSYRVIKKIIMQMQQAMVSSRPAAMNTSLQQIIYKNKFHKQTFHEKALHKRTQALMNTGL